MFTKFLQESDSDSILLIYLYLTKLWSKVKCIVFLRHSHSVYAVKIRIWAIISLPGWLAAGLNVWRRCEIAGGNTLCTTDRLAGSTCPCAACNCCRWASDDSADKTVDPTSSDRHGTRRLRRPTNRTCLQDTSPSRTCCTTLRHTALSTRREPSVSKQWRWQRWWWWWWWWMLINPTRQRDAAGKLMFYRC